MPTADASQWVVATTPKVPAISGRVVNIGGVVLGLRSGQPMRSVRRGKIGRFLGVLILVVGPSGAGKDTLLNGVRAALGEHSTMRFVRRVITRAAPGPGELGEEAHESVSEQEFEVREQAGDFALHWRAHGLRYGIPSDISMDLAQGRVVIANVSRAVVAEAAARFPVGVIEVTAPGEMLAARLVERGPGGDGRRGAADGAGDRAAVAGDAGDGGQRWDAGGGGFADAGRDQGGGGVGCYAGVGSFW